MSDVINGVQRELLKGAAALIEQYVPFPTAACAELRALLTAQPQSAPAGWVPEGWRLVPVNLTKEQIAADPYGMGYGRLHAVWRALLAAAPAQRTQAAGVPDVSAMARVLSDRSADACNIDRTDNWAMYGQEYIEDVQAMLAAPAQPAAQDQGEVQRLREALEGMLEYFPEGASDGECFAVDAARAALAASTGQEV